MIASIMPRIGSFLSKHSLKVTIILLVVLLVISLSAFTYTRNATEEALIESTRDELKSIACVVALGLDGDAIASLEPGDEGTPGYRATQDLLNRIRANNPNIRYIYTMRPSPSGASFVVDADYGYADDAARIGDPYPQNPELMKGFVQPSADVSFTTDQWGSVLSGYAPIRDGTGATVGLVGVDMDQQDVASRLDSIEWILYLVVFAAMVVIAASLVAGAWINSRAAEESRRRLNEQDTLITAMPAGVYVKSRDLVYTAANPVYASFIGSPRDILHGSRDSEILPAETASYHEESDRRVIATGTAERDIPESIQTEDGTMRWLLTNKTPLRDHDGKIIGLVGVSVDITERKHFESALEESKNYLDVLVDAVHAGIVVIDQETHTIVDINRMASDLVGLEKGDIIGKVCHQFICPAEEGLCPVTDLCQIVDQSERRLLTAEGRIIPILKTAIPFVYRGRNYLIESFVDITERKRVEKKTSMISQCFVNFGIDPIVNINQLIMLCGEMMQGTCAVYTRIDFSGTLVRVGSWHAPDDLVVPTSPEAAICYDIMRSGDPRAVVIPDLPSSEYYQLNSPRKDARFQSYTGKTVMIGGAPLGCISVFYHRRTSPSDWDLQMLGIIAAAVGIEEERRLVLEELKNTNHQLDEKVRERTLHLEDAIVHLEEEIAERERAERMITLQRDLGIALGSAADITESMRVIVDAISKVEGIDAGSIVLFSPDPCDLNPISSWGVSDAYVKHVAARQYYLPIVQMLQQGKTFYSDPSMMEQNADAISAEEGIKAIGAIPIRYEGQTFAVLFVASHAIDLIPENARAVLESIAAQIGGVIARVQASEEMKASLDQKMMLLQEIHHRVKNNLAIVSGLLRMQSAAIADEKVLSYFEEAESRILSMALVHDSLYRSKNFAGVDAEAHIRALAFQILRNAPPGVDISLDVDGGGVFLDLDKAIPCSLVLNELIINSIKYAFVGRKNGRICIAVRNHEGPAISLTYRDDGVGIPADIDLAAVKSLGMRLVWNLMTVQLKGTIEVCKDHGTVIVMRFPLPKGKSKKR